DRRQRRRRGRLPGGQGRCTRPPGRRGDEGHRRQGSAPARRPSAPPAPAAAVAAGRVTGPPRRERMVHGGLGPARAAHGATIMVDAAIPGELVDAEIRYRKRSTTFATARRVIEADADRVAAPCPYVPDCGGCQLQHIAYRRQLTLKREIVVDALARQRVPL